MDFKQVEAFVFVAKYKSFSRAAEKLLLSQPTVSTHINTLEENLGVKLFDRLSKEVVLTEAGQLFYPYAVDMMDLRERSHESIKEFLNEISGNLRIGTSTIIAEYILPEVIKNFKESYAKTYFNFTVNNSQTIIQRIADGILDLAIVTRKIPKKDLEYKLFMKDRIVLAVYPGHPLYKRDNVFVEEILKEEFIIREIGSGTRAAVEHSLKQKGYDFDSLNSSATFATTHAVIQAVKSGLGIAFASETALDNKSCASEVKSVPITDLVVEKDIYIVYNKRKSTKKLLKQFLGTLMAYER
ncbi:transcriptional regulator, LysR family [Flexistipes sinusarabici DSM 4947]|uniref:Transcriptional regulator, LysR family n=1 Tax=Flexistipes sinusarabici (strain ATCC 49648 / DSM 4947 / MAS 10) TaxID=717231 RepID=F8E5W6_FLESM|nr:selenium metabolism-associated LysR family transcriptional regulator [Flexistipes sinusarabici]AEI15807.1 transcriptional regulator, LysR family [Flexistipes sinusarabici DSM 4947]